RERLNCPASVRDVGARARKADCGNRRRRTEAVDNRSEFMPERGGIANMGATQRTDRGKTMLQRIQTIAGAALIALCGGCDDTVMAQHSAFEVSVVAQFDGPWAMAFLPDDRLLVTEMRGDLKLLSSDGSVGDVRGVPEVSHGGQGGLGDVVLHPGFADNGLVYLSYAEPGAGGTSGAAVARATLTLDGSGTGGELRGLE